MHQYVTVYLETPGVKNVNCVPNVQYGLWVIQWCEKKIAIEISLDAMVHAIQSIM